MGIPNFDVEDQVSDKQVFTVAAVSTDSIDKGSAAADISIGGRKAFAVYVDSVPAGTVTATSYQIEAIEATNGILTTGIKTVGSATFTPAEMTKGALLEVPINQGSLGSGQYLGIRVTPTGGTAPTVTLSAYLKLQEEITKYKAFPKVNQAVF